MARKTKAIVKAGAYNVATPEGGRRWETILPERLHHWADLANDMIAEGHRIPAPFSHDPRAVPVLMGPGGLPPSSYDNAGYWENFYVGIDAGVPTLFGEIDPPGDETDPRSPAFKIGNTVKDTSIYAEPLFTDGLGKVRQDALLHAAFVLHPIEPGQSPPAAISMASPRQGTSDHALSLVMSNCDYPMVMGNGPPPKGKSKPKAYSGDSNQPQAQSAGSPPGGNQPQGQAQFGGGGMRPPVQTPGKPAREPFLGPDEAYRHGNDITTVLENLRKIAKLNLSDDTTEENILERLNAALAQKFLSESEDGVGVTRRAPPGAVEQSPPIVMANLTSAQLDALIRANVINPATNRPFTQADLQGPTQMGQPATPPAQTPPSQPASGYTSLQGAGAVGGQDELTQLRQATAILMSQTQNQAKASRIARAKALVGRKISQVYFDTHLRPLLDGFQMSFTQGPNGQVTEAPNALDSTLAALESAPDLVRPGHQPLGPSALPHGQSLANVLNSILMGTSGLDLANLQTEPNPYEAGLGQVSDEDADKLADQVLANTGYGPQVNHAKANF